jgi:hypothetical protein
LKRTPLCVLSLDFPEAFDRIAHPYLFTILRAYGLHDWLADRIRHMFEDAASSIHINGHIAGKIPLRFSVRQGCPLSMALFALCDNLLLCYLDTNLEGVRLERTEHRTAVVAYADDVAIFVTRREDFRFIREAIQHYEKASGGRLNIQKSKALTVGGWTGTEIDLGVDFDSNMRIVGIAFSNTIEGAAHNSWSRTTSQVNAQDQQAYARNLYLAQRIRYVHSTLLAPIWYAAQTLPPPETCTRQLKNAVSWYLWRRTTFLVTQTTLQKPKTQRRLALT